MTDRKLPAGFETVEAMEDFMTTPSQALIDDLAKVPGDILVLGVGGKMGPTLARLAKRAAPSKRVMGDVGCGCGHRAGGPQPGQAGQGAG